MTVGQRSGTDPVFWQVSFWSSRRADSFDQHCNED
jgi:hypothetical protein